MNTLLQQKKVISLGVILLLLLAIPLTLYLTRQEQDIRQEAANPTVLAQIDGRTISKNELQDKIEKVYKNSPGSQALQPLIDELIEEKLLQQSAKDLGVGISSTDIREEMNEQGIVTIDSESPLKKEIDTDILREKISRKVAKTRDAFTVGFWIPPTSYDVPLTPEQRTLIEQQRKDATPALTIIEERMRRGDNPLAIARDVSQQFPSLQSIMAVNGYIIATTQNQSLLQQPMLYEFENSRANVAYFKKLFETSSNQVTVVKETGTNDGGSVIRVVGATNGSYNNYKEWLNDQKAKRVKRF